MSYKSPSFSKAKCITSLKFVEEKGLLNISVGTENDDECALDNAFSQILLH